MNTPIHDFLIKYSENSPLRCHMPGDKGQKEPLDITEIKGADSLRKGYNPAPTYSNDSMNLCILCKP